MKNRVCFILLFVLLFAFLIGSNCFASTEDIDFNLTYIPNGFTYNDVYYSFPTEIITSDYPCVAIFYDREISQYILLNTSSYCFTMININGLGYIYFDEPYSPGTIYYYNSLDDIADNNYISTLDCSTISSLSLESSFRVYPVSEHVLYSNYNFYDSTTSSLSSDTCYIAHSTDVNKYEYGSLPQILEGTVLSGVLYEIIALLPIVLVVLIGFIAIRKGLSFLFTYLRQA